MTSNTPPAPVQIEMLELEEYLFSKTAADFCLQNQTGPDPSDHIRGSFRLHRFFVFAWLMQNGVRIPPHLMDDRLHRAVGLQSPDLPPTPTPPTAPQN